MIVLGIADGHTATASLLNNGTIVGMISEERLSRKKGCGGVPAESVRQLLRISGTKGKDIDLVAVSSIVQPVFDLREADASLLRRSVRAFSRLTPGNILASDAVVRNYVRHFGARRDQSGIRRLLDEIGCDRSRIRIVEHHTCHAATAYYLAPFFSPDKETLVFTVDGSGDGLSATVSKCRGFEMERVHSIPSYHSIGEFYMRLTQFMGMKPLEHEYKVMGLAPYAPSEWTDKAFDVMKNFYRVTPDGLSFENTSGRWGRDLLVLLEDSLRGHRFDCIAAAAQRLVEEIVVPFVQNWVAKTGIKRIACAGGVFMNVKMNMLISQVPGIDDLFLMPSSGDESTALGASLHAYAVESRTRGVTPALQPLDNLYLGTEYNSEETLAELEKHRGELEWERPQSIADAAAGLLAKNKILGRLAGRMEWGARSLGNRTILANPSDPRNVRNINRAIKMRDFWMPFCPTILHERRHDYTINPRDLPAKYMINAFSSTPLAFDELICGLHPFDLTCRPQFLTERENPGFYAIVKAFEKRTGIGGVLNTSFNLHGEPIVESPADAIWTFLRSEIDHLVLTDYLVSKKNRDEKHSS